MHYNLEFGGGLGDVLDQMYANGAYHTLRDLGEDDTATVYLITHNPFAAELFLNHPNRDRIKVEVLPYWHPDQDRAERTIRNMPPMGMNQYLPVKYGGVEFFPGPASVDLLRQVVPFDYLVLAAGAGMQERVLPDPVLHLILGTITALTNMPIYAIGRTYTREGRYEPVTDGYPTVVNWVDRLDVPGTCQLVQNAAGLITAHSSMALLGWLEDVPELLVYPESVWNHHAPNNHADQWLRGTRSSTTVHATFDHLRTQDILRFLDIVAHA
jgi:hypothetical protein